jgi:hypothetical protein
MTQRSQQEPGAAANRSPQNESPVFPGKSGDLPAYQPGNLAVQHSLMEIFDDFTQIISGELKSMNLEQFNHENTPRREP